MTKGAFSTACNLASLGGKYTDRHQECEGSSYNGTIPCICSCHGDPEEQGIVPLDLTAGA